MYRNSSKLKKPFKEAFKYWKLFRLVETEMSQIRKTYQNTNNLTYHMDHSQHDSVFCKVHAVLILWMVLTLNLFLCQRWQFLHECQKLLQKPWVLNHSDRIGQPKGRATEMLIHSLAWEKLTGAFFVCAFFLEVIWGDIYSMLNKVLAKLSLVFLLISNLTNGLRLHQLLGTKTTEANKSLKTDANGAH